MGSKFVIFFFFGLSSGNQLLTLFPDRFFHCFMLDESFSHFRGVGTFFIIFYSIFDGKSC